MQPSEINRYCLIGCGHVYECIAADSNVYAPGAQWEFRKVASVEQVAAQAEDLLSEIDPQTTHIFAAVDAQALNFARLEIYGRARL